jgi:hypothetical protein
MPDWQNKNWLPIVTPNKIPYKMPYIARVLPGKTGQQTGNLGQLKQLGNLLPQGPNKIPYKLPFDWPTRSSFVNRAAVIELLISLNSIQQ